MDEIFKSFGAPERALMWAKFDDKFPRHPKIKAAGAQLGSYGRAIAMAFFAESVCWANEWLTDGWVTEADLSEFVSVPRDMIPQVTDVFLAVGLFDAAGVTNGHRPTRYRIHDFLDWNLSAESVKQKRKAEAIRQARHRERLGQA